MRAEQKSRQKIYNSSVNHEADVSEELRVFL